MSGLPPGNNAHSPSKQPYQQQQRNESKVKATGNFTGVDIGKSGDTNMKNQNH